MNLNYQRGAAFERRVQAKLTAENWVCFRSAGSKGGADIIALKPGQTLFIECKTNGVLPPADWDELIAHAAKCDATPCLADGSIRGGALYQLTGYAGQSRLTNDRKLRLDWNGGIYGE